MSFRCKLFAYYISLLHSAFLTKYVVAILSIYFDKLCYLTALASQAENLNGAPIQNRKTKDNSC